MPRFRSASNTARRTWTAPTGDAAVEYALDTIEQNIRLCRDPWDDDLGVQRYDADVFRPRWGLVPPVPSDPNWQPGALAMENPNAGGDENRLWEPRMKVRPLLAMSVDAEPGSLGEEKTWQLLVEQHIGAWLGGVCDTRECDFRHGMGAPGLVICLVGLSADQS